MSPPFDGESGNQVPEIMTRSLYLVHGLTPAQYGVLSVLAREPGASGADLARACSTTPQAMNGVLGTLERESLIERRPHPTHGRILQATLTTEGRRRLEAANPAMQALRRTIERDLT